MGEVVICTGNGKTEDIAMMEGVAQAGSTSSSVAMWERFLPKMVVRVLLVEADDSTRQIIAALLRKCSYRVAAVADGLKAWEVLRGRPCNIDLVLTEVDLPLISGYALLSLIMEHEVCKNIPVIMMSSHDSVNTVYKCMLRGATDYLVKPIRKNELTNLWQHVWRKQASSNAAAAGLGPPDESIGQKKDDATAENNAASDNNSSRCVACARRSRECTDKGSEAQSSCSKPNSGNDGDEDVQDFPGVSNPKSSELVSECRSQGEKNAQVRDSSVEAMDLIKSFENHPNVAVGSSVSTVCSDKLDAAPQLDLSLQRSRMNHSEASPFLRYINKPGSSTLMSNELKDNETMLETRASMQDPSMASQKHISASMVETVKGETSLSQNKEMPHPVPVRGLRYENVNGFDSLVSHLAQTHKEQCLPMDHDSCAVQVYSLLDQRNIVSIDHMDNKRSNKSDSLGNENLLSPGTNQIQGANASFCNSNTSTTKIIIPPSECGNENNYHSQDGLLHRSMKREAALTKFRLKRKERCFEKKVRYESRKKLAEQRPRVKGQFVRQMPTDLQPGNSSAG